VRAVRYQAAGGIVIDADRILVLQRPSRNEVRLPKGHVEKGETARETALREVTEESGYADLEILADLGDQTIEFNFRGDHVIRDEHYFAMRLCGASQTQREPKEEQFIPAWLGWDEALAALTFDSEREWARRAQRALSTPPPPRC
jgi:8-oxo-dGTP pyrophosphatase MutT (NUDIX family)